MLICPSVRGAFALLVPAFDETGCLRGCGVLLLVQELMYTC